MRARAPQAAHFPVFFANRGPSPYIALEGQVEFLCPLKTQQNA